MFFYLGEQATGTTLPEEWADLLQVGAVADVLKVRHFSRWTRLGQVSLLRTTGQPLLESLSSFLVKKGHPSDD